MALIELLHEEAEQLLSLPPKQREVKIVKLKRDIQSGEHARHMKFRLADNIEAKVAYRSDEIA